MHELLKDIQVDGDPFQQHQVPVVHFHTFEGPRAIRVLC